MVLTDHLDHQVLVPNGSSGSSGVSGSSISLPRHLKAVLTGPIGTHTHSSISGLNVAAGSEGDLVTGTMANVLI
jgi:hypothetical protein